MSQRFTYTSPMVLVKLALGLAAALATMFALMAATSSPAQANPTCQVNGVGVLVCNNPITVGNVNINVLSQDKILNGNQITVVKQEIEKGCGGIVQVGCINVTTLVSALNVKFHGDPKILGILFI